MINTNTNKITFDRCLTNVIHKFGFESKQAIMFAETYECETASDSYALYLKIMNEEI